MSADSPVVVEMHRCEFQMESWRCPKQGRMLVGSVYACDEHLEEARLFQAAQERDK